MEILTRFALAAVCALGVASSPIMASEPSAHGPANEAASNGGSHSNVEKGASPDTSLQALRARFPARAAEYRADGSIAQYIGASHLMQTAVRIGADGKLEALSTTDAEAVQRFITSTASDDETDEEGGTQ